MPTLCRVILVLSNSPLLIPGVLAIRVEAHQFAVIAFLMMILSMLHHITEKDVYSILGTPFEVADLLFAIAFLAFGPVILFSAQASSREWILATMTTVFSIGLFLLARHFRRERNIVQYVAWHSVWHVSTAFLCTVVYAISFNTVSF